jgi:hypothetical protein
VAQVFFSPLGLCFACSNENEGLLGPELNTWLPVIGVQKRRKHWPQVSNSGRSRGQAFRGRSRTESQLSIRVQVNQSRFLVRQKRRKRTDKNCLILRSIVVPTMLSTDTESIKSPSCMIEQTSLQKCIRHQGTEKLKVSDSWRHHSQSLHPLFLLTRQKSVP